LFALLYNYLTCVYSLLLIQGEKAVTEYGVWGAALTCVPFEPKACVTQLEKTKIGQMLYIPSFMNILLDKAAAHSKLHPERLPAETFAGIKTFR
jgi:predicted alpha/beta-fold hydrolase